MSYIENKNILENFIKYFLIIGLLSSFTTFSYKVIDLFTNKKFIMSFIYILLTLILCIFFSYLGYNLNKY